MTFYLESQYLNLNKKYQAFEYEKLVDMENPNVQHLAIQDPSLSGGENVNEGIAQNTYLFVQEKDLIAFDVANLIAFMRKYRFEYLDHKTLTTNVPPEVQAKGDKFPFEQIKNRVSFVFQKYQEQPALLDSLIESVVVPLMALVEEYLLIIIKAAPIEFTVIPEIHSLVSIIYVLCKVRGYKYITKFFPHEVKDLEPVLYYLVNQRTKDNEVWETKYVFILWLSIIVLVPFDLKTIDSALTSLEPAGENDKSAKTIHDNIIDVGKFYINSPMKTRDAAAIVLSKFFSRPDIQKTDLLKNYLNWAAETIKRLEDDPFSSFFVTGIFSSLVEIFKVGQRNELLDKIPLIFRLISDEEEESKTQGKKKKVVDSSSLRHYKSKLAQRIALQYLKPRLNTWAYKRSSNSLIENFKKTLDNSKLQTNVISKVTMNTTTSTLDVQLSTKGGKDQQGDDDDYFDDVNTEHLESIIDFLLTALKDKDTVVRWSAAKGIGRITQRLDQDMADEIVNSLLKLFSPHEGDGAWHGSCLAVAELSRRGLLLPERLKEVFPILFRALLFDQNQGNYSVGSHVRDAACYVAWAFARAYDPSLIKEHMLSLAQHLLIVSLFDREINCRRAASAAFQEHVGRQGNFPHGINILTEADYFTLGVRSNAYLNVSIFVGQYEEYFQGFVDHLATIKLKNWDPEVRRLAAATLSLFSPLHPDYLSKRILPSLVPLCLNESVLIRHGAIYGVSEIIIGLAGKSHLHCCVNLMKDSIFLKSLSKNEKKLIKAGEYMQAFREKYEGLKEKDNLVVLDETTLKEVIDIVAKIEKARLYRGKGGEVMRNGVCRLIECISYAGLKLGDAQIKRYMETLEECLKNPITDIQDSAEKALSAFSERYQGENRKEFALFVEKFLKSASTDPNVAVTRGYTRGLASLSTNLIRIYWEKIIKVLSENCEKKMKELDDVDTRKYAIAAFEKIVIKFLEEDVDCTGKDLPITQETLEGIFKTAFSLMGDYTMDKRGDIGSIVREASMYVMLNLIKEVSLKYKKNPNYPLKITENIVFRVVCELFQQLAEKIDRTRLIAGSILQEIVDNYHSLVPDYPHKQKVQAVFCRDNIVVLMQNEQNRISNDYSLEEETKGKSFATISTQQQDGENADFKKDFVYYWNVSHCVYPVIVPFLEYPEYSYHLVYAMF